MPVCLDPDLVNDKCYGRSFGAFGFNCQHLSGVRCCEKGSNFCRLNWICIHDEIGTRHVSALFEYTCKFERHGKTRLTSSTQIKTQVTHALTTACGRIRVLDDVLVAWFQSQILLHFQHFHNFVERKWRKNWKYWKTGNEVLHRCTISCHSC